MEIQKKQRKILRCSFTKAANELEELLKDKNQLSSSIEMSWESLKLKFDELHLCHGVIYQELLKNASEEELIADIDGQDVYIKRFTGIKLKCLKVLEVRPV